jgi:hypothetical protein
MHGATKEDCACRIPKTNAIIAICSSAEADAMPRGIARCASMLETLEATLRLLHEELVVLNRKSTSFAARQS